jgi:peptide/nickel transport system permease protein
MAKFIIKRLLMLIPIMLGVITIVFVLRAMTPGDPVDNIVGENASPELRQQVSQELGLDQPLPVQYFRYAAKVFRGDLGTSYRTKRSVLSEIMQRLPVSLLITFGAVILGLLLGVPLGVTSALRQYSALDNIIRVLSMIFQATPGFCLGLGLISLFSVKLHLLPANGLSNGLGLILPMLTIGLSSMAMYTRITRTSMLEVIREDYIRTARAKGQSEKVITYKHALRNAMLPIAASIGNQVGHQLGGALIVETVFGIPGMGKYIADAITARNYPSIQGGVLVLALLFTIINLIVDISFVFINPRLKTSILSIAQRHPHAKQAAV